MCKGVFWFVTMSEDLIRISIWKPMIYLIMQGTDLYLKSWITVGLFAFKNITRICVTVFI